MSLLLLHIIVIYIKENIITKLQRLESSPRNPKADNKSPAVFVKKPLCMDDLSPTRKIFIERPVNIRRNKTTVELFSTSTQTENLAVKSLISFYSVRLLVDFSTPSSTCLTFFYVFSFILLLLHYNQCIQQLHLVIYQIL